MIQRRGDMRTIVKHVGPRRSLVPTRRGCEKIEPGDFLIEMRRCRISIGTRTVVSVGSATSDYRMRYCQNICMYTSRVKKKTLKVGFLCTVPLV